MPSIVLPTDKRVFKVWWSIWWRTIFFTAIIVGGIGSSLGVFDVTLSPALGVLIGMYINFVVVKRVLTRKLYSDFTIALIEKERTIEALKSFGAPVMIEKGKIFFWSRKESRYLNEEEYLEKLGEQRVSKTKKIIAKVFRKKK